MYSRDDEKLQCRDGDQAGHFSASQGAEPAGFSAQNSSAEVKDSCSRAEHVQVFGSRTVKVCWRRAEDVAPLRGRFDSPLIRDFREPARLSYRTIDKTGRPRHKQCRGPWRRASMERSLIRDDETKVIEIDYTADTRKVITMVGMETPTTSDLFGGKMPVGA